MERLLLTFLLGVFLLAAADATVSSIRTISGGKSTTFSLPESKTFVLAMKSAEAPKIKYQYHAQGRLIADDKCDDCYQGSLWVPFLTITEKGIKRYDSGTNWFPENIGSSQARSLSIESKGFSTVELQTFTLPLKEPEMVRMPRGESVNISLPEKEEIWLALWNKQETAVLVTFNLYYETEPAPESFKVNVDKGWFIIRIFKYKILYEKNNYPLSKHEMKGRRLEWYNPSSIKYQLFTMPLDPKDPKEETDTNESVDTDGTLILMSVVVFLVLLLLVAICLGYRFCWKKKREELREGSPRVTVAGAGGLTRQNSSHDSENSIYGAEIVTHGDVTRQNSAHDSENSLYGVTVR